MGKEPDRNDASRGMDEELLRASYENVFQEMHEGLYFVDRKRTITYWNKAAEQISGFSKEEVIGKSCADNILAHVDEKGNLMCLTMCPLAKTIGDGRPREAEYVLHHKNGHRVPVRVRVNAVRDSEGKIVGGVELFTDLSDEKARELRLQELERIALLDELTQLANRHYVEREIQSRIEERKRFQVPFGILFMDIDNFKNINDRYGHIVGDEVLKMVARTISNHSRSFDLYGRWGGEEFVGVIRNVSEKNLDYIAQRVCTLVRHSYITHEGEHLSVTLSIGATLARDEDSMQEIIDRADHLMYKSKQAGKDRVTLG